MTLALTSTCVGGRRAIASAPPETNLSTKPQASIRAGVGQQSVGVGGRLWGLTRREEQVLEAVIQLGHGKIAAAELDIAGKTLEIHMARVREKAGMRHIAPLVAAYVTAKLKAEAGAP